MPGAFNIGEISPTQIGNLGKEYDQATLLQQGFVSTPDGVTMVPGYEYAANTKSNAKARLECRTNNVGG